jgi:hypothetical protein
MTKVNTILMKVAALFLGGCSHSQWASVELATVGASWLHPVATVVHMTASAGRAMTDPQDELRDKVQQREEDQKKDLPTEQLQSDPPRTETK